MMFLDFLYLVCCDFYKKREADMFKFSGVILVTLVFTFNIMFVSLVLYNGGIMDQNPYDYRYQMVLFCVLPTFLLLLLRYFYVTNYHLVNNKSYLLGERRRGSVYLAAVCYVILSIVSVLATIFYLGGRVNGWWK